MALVKVGGVAACVKPTAAAKSLCLKVIAEFDAVNDASEVILRFILIRKKKQENVED